MSTSTSWVASELAAVDACARPALPHSLSVTAGGKSGPVDHTASLISDHFFCALSPLFLVPWPFLLSLHDQLRHERT
jgi:hypothetical protein